MCGSQPRDKGTYQIVKITLFLSAILRYPSVIHTLSLIILCVDMSPVIKVFFRYTKKVDTDCKKFSVFNLILSH